MLNEAKAIHGNGMGSKAINGFLEYGFQPGEDEEIFGFYAAEHASNPLSRPFI